MNPKRTLTASLAALLLGILPAAADGGGKKLSFNPFKKRADLAMARAEGRSVELAIQMYRLDNGKLPVLRVGDGDRHFETKGYIIRVLTGHNDEGLNPRQRVYVELREAKGDRGGLADRGDKEKARLLDPWGRPYRVILDADGDGVIKTPDGKEIRASIGVYSLGPDGEVSDDDPRSWD